MKSIQHFEHLYLHRDFVDLRKNIYGLSVIVQTEMKLDLKSSSIFIFTNRRRTIMKILYFDHSGFALWLKKLEESKYPWPKNMDQDVIELTANDMELLLAGINIWTKFKTVSFTTVV